MNEQTTGFLIPWMRFRHGGGGFLDVGHRLRRENDQAHVDVLILQNGAQRGLVAVGAGIADHVDGVAQRGGGGQRRP